MSDLTFARDKINANRLHEQLRAQFGERCSGLTGEGGRVHIHFEDTPSAEDEQAASAIVSAHNDQEASAGEIVRQRQKDARTNAAKIPAWATMTEAEAVTFIQNNVTDLASAKQVLVAMARIIVHLRDAQWPDLGDEEDARI